jgi:diguanylate cyclase (GGDEF)-like protein
MLDSENQLPLSVITGDINGLKIINDAMGHSEGDRLLMTISNILTDIIPKKDIISRIGGDEFNILMPKTTGTEALAMIERIDAACGVYNRSMNNELYNISISLGVATKLTMNESLERVIKAAEDNMYKRKLLESRSLHSAIISSMKTVLFEKSQETEEHARRLAKLTRTMGQVIGLKKQQFDELELFSTLHDIGKIGIDDHILNKPGKLTDKEWTIMKKHSEIGYRIAMASPELMSVADYILTHHERWDGKGYPQGLPGGNIPLLSRILAVADAYDAMTSDRPYRKAMPKEAAIEEILKNAGTQFDPEISRIFVELARKEQ